METSLFLQEMHQSPGFFNPTWRLNLTTPTLANTSSSSASLMFDHNSLLCYIIVEMYLARTSCSIKWFTLASIAIPRFFVIEPLWEKFVILLKLHVGLGQQKIMGVQISKTTKIQGWKRKKLSPPRLHLLFIIYFGGE